MNDSSVITKKWFSSQNKTIGHPAYIVNWNNGVIIGKSGRSKVDGQKWTVKSGQSKVEGPKQVAQSGFGIAREWKFDKYPLDRSKRP